MGNVKMDATQINDRTGASKMSVAQHLKALDAIATAIEGLPTFTSDDRAFLEELPAFPSEHGKKALVATTESGGTTLNYEKIEHEEYAGGDYIDITGRTISVNREIPSTYATYTIKSDGSDGGTYFIKVTKKVNDEVVQETRYATNTAGINQGLNFDENLFIAYSKTTSLNWEYTCRNASVDHSAGFKRIWYFTETVEYTEDFYIEDNTGYTLVTKSEFESKVPPAPSADGAYKLTATVSSGNVVYSWVSE